MCIQFYYCFGVQQLYLFMFICNDGKSHTICHILQELILVAIYKTSQT